jgi:hypothetical protein
MLSAYALMTEQLIVNQAQTSEVKRFEAPNVTIEYGTAAAGASRTVEDLPQEAMALLSPLLAWKRLVRA